MSSLSTLRLLTVLILLVAPIGCGKSIGDASSSSVKESAVDAPPHTHEVASTSAEISSATRDDEDSNVELTAAERETLSSFRKVHDYPLYVMTYSHEYDPVVAQTEFPQLEEGIACSLFTAFHGPDGSLMGRNFDWHESPAMLLFTKADNGYASVSMVDISYLGYNQFNLEDLETIEGRRGLLRAPLIPFDGMNDQGLVVSMAAVPDATIPEYEGKPTIVSVTLMRLMLDQAKSVDEALDLVDDYNLDFAGGPNIHYLVADRDGNSALIELKNQKVNIYRNEEPWQIATNFYLTGVIGMPEDSCARYASLSKHLSQEQGKLSLAQAMESLRKVAQSSTRWSMVYAIDSLEARMVLNRNFDAPYVISLKDQTIKQQEMSTSSE